MTDTLVHQVDVVVVGGGIAGLAALHSLGAFEAVLLESEPRCGGRILSSKFGEYTVNLGAHILASTDSPMVRLADELNVETLQITGRTNLIWHQGRLLRGHFMELYPFKMKLPLAARASLIASGLRLKALYRQATQKVPDPIHGARKYNGVFPTVEVDPELDATSFEAAMGWVHAAAEPIFQSAVNRLGAEPSEVSAGFAASVIGKHLSNNGGKDLRTPKGGMQAVVDALARRYENRISRGTRATQIMKGGDHYETTAIGPDGKTIRYKSRCVIMAVPAHVVLDIVEDLPTAKRAGLESVKYGPYVVAAIQTKETGVCSFDDVYSVTVAGLHATMIFNAANPQRKQNGNRQDGGVFIVYAGAGKASDLMPRGDDEILSILTKDLCQVFPEIKDAVEGGEVQRWPNGYPFWPPGRAGHQPNIAAPHGNMFFAGDYVEYPSTDPAARSGFMAAEAAMNALAKLPSELETH